jgi:uncharacterized protein (TIGR02147 family)
LLGLIASYPKAGRGLRKQLAQFIGCQEAYVTQVLSGPAHFSPEQGEAAARFFQLGGAETEFFLLLIAHNRAGTRALKGIYENQLTRLRAQAKQLGARLAAEPAARKDFRPTYYSGWQYAAVHMALQITETRTAARISQRLGIPVRRVNAILGFLEETGLAKRSGEEFLPEGSAGLHLERQSPLVVPHHTTWRMKAVQAVNDREADSLHYSGVVTCSRADRELIQEKLSQCLEQCIQIVKDSPSEELVALNIDWFGLGAGK